MDNLNFLPHNIKELVVSLQDVPNYINRKQLAAACEVELNTLTSWKEILPKPDIISSNKYYWTLDKIADFIYNYRKNNNKPLA